MPSCFYGKDTVNLVDGGQRAIEDLKIGDRIWTLNHRGTALFQDEVIFMMDNGPKKTGKFHLSSSTIPFNLHHLALFYTFKTKQGNEISLTATHNIYVYLPEQDRIEHLRASKVTLNHRLIMHSQKVDIESITLNSRVGYYSPLTLSSYLYINNISASAFADRYENLSENRD